MSAIDPRKKAIIQELQRRKGTLDPQMSAVVDELSRRAGVGEDPNAAIKAQQDVGAIPSQQEDLRSTYEVVQDQTAQAVEGAGLAHPIETATTLGSAAKDMLTGKGSAKAQELLQGIITGLGQTALNLPSTIATTIKGGSALVNPANEAPTRAEFEAASNNAGAVASNVPLAAAIATKVPGAVARGLRIPEWMYQKALQPSPRALSLKEIDVMVKTGLDNGLRVSRAGLNKLDTLVRDLNTAIEADIASNPNAPVMPSAVASRLQPTRAKAGTQVNPDADLRAISAAEREFLKRNQTPETPATEGTPATTDPYTGVTIPGTPGTPAVPATDIPIPASSAQAIKKGTYQQLNAKAYGEIGSGSSEAQKALARGLKEELEVHFPEIKGKNAAEGKLIDLRPELEAAVNRMGNRWWSLHTAMQALVDPAITSTIAIALRKAGNNPATVASRIAQFTASVAAMSNGAKKEPSGATGGW